MPLSDSPLGAYVVDNYYVPTVAGIGGEPNGGGASDRRRGRPGVRLLASTGPAGTRLAVRAARRPASGRPPLPVEPSLTRPSPPIADLPF